MPSRRNAKAVFSGPLTAACCERMIRQIRSTSSSYARMIRQIRSTSSSYARMIRQIRSTSSSSKDAKSGSVSTRSAMYFATGVSLLL